MKHLRILCSPGRFVIIFFLTSWPVLIPVTRSQFARAQTSFGPERVLSELSDISDPTAVRTVDLDGDGDLDVLISALNDSSLYDGKIGWYENLDGRGGFGSQRLIASKTGSVNDVYTADLDNDGDQDVVSAVGMQALGRNWISDYGRLTWYENTDGQGNFGRMHEIHSSDLSFRSVHSIDMDGDGDQDLLTGQNLGADTLSNVSWYENTNGQGSFGPPHLIGTDIATIFPADFDGDGDPDVLFSSSYDSHDRDPEVKIGWYENVDGAGSFGPQRLIVTLWPPPTSVIASDLDLDGDQDVLLFLIADGEDRIKQIAWFENLDGQGNFSTPQVIGTVNPGCDGPILPVDFDSDGDLDVIYGCDIRIAWIEHSGNDFRYNERAVVTTEVSFVNSLAAADLDADGVVNLISASFGDDKIAWYTNNNDGISQDQHVLSNPADVRYFNSAFPVDLDADGDMDVLYAGQNETCVIGWYENIDSLGDFILQQQIESDVDCNTSISATDFDEDGDQDFFTFNEWSGEIAWYENPEGREIFGTKHPITPPDVASTCARATMSDFDRDGDKDVIAYDCPSFDITWYENEGKGIFRQGQIITRADSLLKYVHVADLDSDGDQDILYSSFDGRIAWYQNNGSSGFTPQQLINESGNTFGSAYGGVDLLDLDNDGDWDVLFSDENKLTWFENSDGQGSFSTENIIASGDFSDYWPLLTADLDGDQGQDIIYRGSSSGGRIIWYQNIDGTGSFGSQQRITSSAVELSSIHTADFDGDGAPDILTNSFSKLSWYENQISSRTAIEDSGELPHGFTLSSAYPNPFNSATTFSLSLEHGQRIAITIFDMLGRRRDQLHDGWLPDRETHQFHFDAGNLPSGTYLIRVGGEEFTAYRSVVLLK